MGKIRSLYETHKDFIMEVIHFGMVGVMNTLMGWVIIFVLYNLIHMNYWLSSGISYFIGSVFSYHANSKLTFKVENKDKGLPWRFAINIIVCYLIAFSVAQPFVKYILSFRSIASIVNRITGIVNYIAGIFGAGPVEPEAIVDNIALVFGMGLFIILNFFGQKLFVFRKREKKG
ncbi:MAG: GtrA family protein [Lachnospiraceae bacterium]|nr:GtrA family protein [Lachnospiraceae bacterium]